MTEPTRKLQVYIAKDVPCYMSIEVEVPESIVNTGGYVLTQFIAGCVEANDNDGDLDSFDPEWENANQLRVISANDEDTQQVLCGTFPIEVAYYDIASELIRMMRDNTPPTRGAILQLLRSNKVDI